MIVETPAQIEHLRNEAHGHIVPLMAELDDEQLHQFCVDLLE